VTCGTATGAERAAAAAAERLVRAGVSGAGQ
jgi:hypothetical protein